MAIAVVMALKAARNSAVDVVLHAAAASCECSNLSLACGNKLVSLSSSSSSL